jgi:hypothetical protein
MSDKVKDAIHVADKEGVFAPVVKDTAKMKLANVLRKGNGVGIFIMTKELSHELLINGTEALQTIGSQFRALLKDGRISFKGLRAAAKAGEAMIQVEIQAFQKGNNYYTADGEDTYIAGEKLTDLEDGAEIHRAVVTKIVVTAKGAKIAAQSDETEERIRDFARQNPEAYLKALMGLGNANAPKGKASAASDVEETEEDDLDEEPIIEPVVKKGKK